MLTIVKNNFDVAPSESYIPALKKPAKNYTKKKKEVGVSSLV